jgi:glutathione S-transferase
MYTLYYMPGAASFAVHWLLIELGVPFELRCVNSDAQEQKAPEYLKLNPNGLVPTLIVEGRPVYESAALMLLLAERHPEARLSPAPGSPERATYLLWTVHLANTVQPAFRHWFYPSEAAGEAHVEAAKAQARERLERAWDRLDAHLAARGPWTAGERLTAVDFSAAMLARWSRNMPRPATDWPAIRRLVTAMKARPSFRMLNESEALTEWA